MKKSTIEFLRKHILSEFICCIKNCCLRYHVVILLQTLIKKIENDRKIGAILRDSVISVMWLPKLTNCCQRFDGKQASPEKYGLISLKRHTYSLAHIFSCLCVFMGQNDEADFDSTLIIEKCYPTYTFNSTCTFIQYAGALILPEFIFEASISASSIHHFAS